MGRATYEVLSQCGGKTPYPSHSVAWREAKRSDPRGKHAMSAYRCQVCRAFHMGHSRRDHTAKRRAQDIRQRLRLQDLESDLV